MRLENLGYSFFGNNLVIGSHIRKQLSFLKEIVPAELQHREMDDLGCGDGKVTVLLEEIFRPTKLRGFDINPALVGRARSRGINAGVIDLDMDITSGELAVVWGVLHHLRNLETCLSRLTKNYPLIFIREPVKTGFINGLELGHPLNLEEITRLASRYLPDAKIHYCYDSIMILYACPGYIKQQEDFFVPVKSSLFHESNIAGRC
ncbi:MAG: methyltransferase domain-containing protein [Dehalococcoidales bacterium]|jgi:SAM-dependent methyltransferase